MLALVIGRMLLCSDRLPSGRQWRNGLRLFHGLELCSALEMLLRSHCLTELDPELVAEALVNCPAFAISGVFYCFSTFSLLMHFYLWLSK